MLVVKVLRKYVGPSFGGMIVQKGTSKCGAVAQSVVVMILPLFLSFSYFFRPLSLSGSFC